MAQMAQKLVLVLALASFLDMILGMEYVVGGDVQKWDFLHTNDSPNLYNNWAANQTFKTGGILLFEYDNATHSVLQVVEGDFTSCNIDTPLQRWMSGNDSVFLADAGTFYYVCGTPLHCNQGMKVAITATGPTVAAPPPPRGPIAPPPASPSKPSPNHAARSASFSFAFSALGLLAILIHAASVWL